jgi:hypothetical protein
MDNEGVYAPECGGKQSTRMDWKAVYQNEQESSLLKQSTRITISFTPLMTFYDEWHVAFLSKKIYILWTYSICTIYYVQPVLYR